MLDKAFIRRFFDQIEACSAEELDKKIAEVEKVKSMCPKGSEAYQDARFMLRHMYRMRLDGMFKQ